MEPIVVQESAIIANESARERKYYADGANYVSVFINAYGKQTKQNLDGKPFTQWNASDLRKLQIGELHIIQDMFDDEHYDLIDRIKPSQMTRAEYARSINREIASRGDAALEYSDRQIFGFTGAPITVKRPLNVPESQKVSVDLTPAQVTIRDAIAKMMSDPTAASLRIPDDVASKLGKRKDFGYLVLTDAEAFNLGYSAGAVSKFRPGQKAQMGVSFESQNPSDIQRGFCAVTNNIFGAKGRVVNQLESITAGFIQARNDAKFEFQDKTKEIGIFEQCSPKSTPLTPEVRAAFASRLKSK